MAKVAIIGGSLAGLSTASVLRGLGHNVVVFEREHKPLDNRGSSLGFVDNRLWEFLKNTKMMRRGRQAHRGQGAYYYGDLWKFWYQDLPQGTIQFGRTILHLGDDPMRPTIDGEEYDFVVLADGGWSTLRQKYITDKQPEYSGTLIYRLKVSKKDFPDFHSERTYTAGKVFSIALEVAMDNGQDWIMGGVSIPIPERNVRRPESAVNRQADWKETTQMPSWFLPYIRVIFQEHKQLVQWIEMAVHGPGKITAQPLFEFATDKVRNGRIVMIGDAAHMASPGTAAGAHTGILDAAGLWEAFSQFSSPDDIDQALSLYEKGGLSRAVSLYTRSKQVSAPLSYQTGDELLYEAYAENE